MYHAGDVETAALDVFEVFAANAVVRNGDHCVLHAVGEEFVELVRPAEDGFSGQALAPYLLVVVDVNEAFHVEVSFFGFENIQRHPRVFYACGHGHYGLTWAGVTARLVGDLLAGGEAPDYDLCRFAR